MLVVLLLKEDALTLTLMLLLLLLGLLGGLPLVAPGRLVRCGAPRPRPRPRPTGTSRPGRSLTLGLIPIPAAGSACKPPSLPSDGLENEFGHKGWHLTDSEISQADEEDGLFVPRPVDWSA